MTKQPTPTNQPLAVSLDLDHTLINAASQPRADWADNHFFELPDGDMYWATLRPGAQWLVNKLLDQPDRFLVGVYTQATREYAEAVIRLLVEEDRRQELAFVLDRNRTKYDIDHQRVIALGDVREAPMINHKSAKKVARAAKCKVRNIVALDDRPDVWQNYYGNLLAVPAFHQPEKNDSILRGAYKALCDLERREDVRPIDKRGLVLRLARKIESQRTKVTGFDLI